MRLSAVLFSALTALIIANGTGAEMRQPLGTAVFFGMIGVTASGLIYTPLFYVACHILEARLLTKNCASENEHQLDI